jgi:hypothetical protein
MNSEQYALIGKNVVEMCKLQFVNKSSEDTNNFYKQQNKNFDEKLEKLSDISSKFEEQSNKLIGINASSSTKGAFAENNIEKKLREYFPQYSVINTSKLQHSGDIQIKNEKNGFTILIELKKYKTTVSSKEVDKFINDMEYTNSNFGIFASLTSNIVGRPKITLEHNRYLYIPCCNLDINSLFTSIELCMQMQHVQKLTYSDDNKIKNIKNKLTNFEKRLKNLFNNVPTLISDIYVEVKYLNSSWTQL